MLKSLLFILLFVINSVSSKGQPAELTVSFNKYKLNPGDTVDIDFYLQSQNHNHKKATINCIIKNDEGFEKKLRWPLLNKTGVIQLIIDKKLKYGFYDFYFYVQEGIFQLNGKIISPGNQSVLKAVLMNNKGGVTLSEVKVDAGNTFKFSNYIFENFANVIFSDKKGKQNKLDIRIEALLDSAYQPLAITARRIRVGGNPTTDFNTAIILEKKDSLLNNSSTFLKEVIVYATKKNAVDRYEENYVGGIFKDAESRAFNLIDDQQALASTDVLEYLQVKLPNMRIKYNKNGEGSVLLRNAPVQFYLDEIPMDIGYIRSVSVADIAVVKFFNAPFIGNPGGNGAAVAVYTRRGGDIISKSTGNYRFRVKGFTPALSILSSNY